MIPNIVKRELELLANAEGTPFTFNGIKFRVAELTPDELEGKSTACGIVGKAAFSRQLCDTLRDEGVRIAAMLYDDGSRIEIGALALRCTAKRAKLVERAVNRCGGSFRLEDDDVDGWWTYESE